MKPAQGPSRQTIFNAHFVAAGNLYDAQKRWIASKKMVDELTQRLDEAYKVLQAAKENMDMKRIEESKASEAFQNSIWKDLNKEEKEDHSKKLDAVQSWGEASWNSPSPTHGSPISYCKFTGAPTYAQKRSTLAVREKK